MSKKVYLTTLNTRPFLYRESKLIAEFVLEGLTIDEIKEEVLNNNLFQLSNVDRAGRFFREILKRLEFLDPFLIENFCTKNPQTSKCILLYALLKKDHLLYEWMREIVWDKFRIYDFTLTQKETEQFLRKKEEQNKTVKNWNEDTKDHLIDAYHQVLKDAGYSFQIDSNEVLQYPIIDPIVKNYLVSKCDSRISEVVLGEVIIETDS